MPNFQWQVNGVNVGSNSIAFTSSGLQNGDVVTCLLTSSLECATGNPASSNAITMAIRAKPSTPIVTLTGNVLSSSAPAGNQWFDQSGPIPGATGREFLVAENQGQFYVIVSLQGCSSDPSNSINVITRSTEPIDNSIKVSVFPNPFAEKLTIRVEGNNGLASFAIFDAMGQVFVRGEFHDSIILPTNELAPGFYLVQVKNGVYVENMKIIKK